MPGTQNTWRQILSHGLITFSYDDGLLNNYTRALPIHEQYGIRPSFAIITRRAADARWRGRHMSEDEVRDAVRRGVEINSHSLTHRQPLTQVSVAEMHDEVVKSRSLLEQMLHSSQEVETFCVPFSAWNEEILAVAEQHYFYVRGHGKNLNNQRMQQRFLHSFGVHADTTFEHVAELIAAAERERKWLILMLHGVVGDESPATRFEIHEGFLRRLLAHVNSLGPDRIRPVQFRDVISARRAHLEWCGTPWGRISVALRRRRNRMRRVKELS